MSKPQRICRVYFIRAADETGPVKIGISDDPRRRLAELQKGSPQTLKLLASFEGTFRDERTLHEAWAHLRLHGEWFEHCREMDSFLAGIVMGKRDERARAKRRGLG